MLSVHSSGELAKFESVRCDVRERLLQIVVISAQSVRHRTAGSIRNGAPTRRDAMDALIREACRISCRYSDCCSAARWKIQPKLTILDRDVESLAVQATSLERAHD
jgi:hypothetical protein